MFRRWKDFARRCRLAWRGVRTQVAIPTFSAGARSGVWTVCTDGVGPDSVVYSVGVGNNIAWDLAMIERFGVTVQAFDPTPASVAWVAEQRLPTAFAFHPLGLGGHDGAMSLRRPRDGKVNCYLGDPATGNNDVVQVAVARLQTIMRRLGHSGIDVLKMDIEGAEYDVIADVLESGVRVRQWLIEFHDHLPNSGLDRLQTTIRRMNDAGYRVFHISGRGLEFSFIKV